MQTYSTIVVIDSLLKNEEIDNIIEKIERNIKNNGGEILETDLWGKKRLAYEIKKRQYGYFVEILFEATGDVTKIIERDYRLEENILRFLTIKLDKKSLQQRQKGKEIITQKSEKKEFDEFDEIILQENELDQFESLEKNIVKKENEEEDIKNQ